MKALVTEGKKYGLECREIPVPTPADEQILMRVRAVAICGGDLKVYRNDADPPYTQALIPGHEFSGVIEAVGAGSSSRKAGERGIAIPTAYCGECESCKDGKINLCEYRRVIGGVKPTGYYNGGMAEYVCVPARNFIPIPDGLGFETAALTEPLAVGLHALRKAGVVEGKDVTIIGAGPIGLILLILARHYGAKSVSIIDILESRMPLAASLGADRVYVGSLPESAGRSDIVFDAVGEENTLGQAIRHCVGGGRVMMVGLAQPLCQVDCKFVIDHEIQLRGSITYTEAEIRECIDLLAEGAVSLDPLVTDTVPLTEGPALFRGFIKHPERHIKGVLLP